MSSNEKQSYIKHKYIDNIKNYRETYEKRKDFLRGWSISTYKKGTSSNATTDGEPTNNASTGTTSVVLNGAMPTSDQYTGPDSSVHQKGLRAKLKGTDQWNDLILKYCTKHGVNPILAKCVMATESGGNANIGTNSSNCTGLMQLRKRDMEDMGWGWDKIVNDHEYNIECGVIWIKEKHSYCGNVIKNNGSKVQYWTNKGFAPKQTVHGTAWFYYGFTKDQTPKDYADHMATLYAGFGRNAHVDTAIQTDVLGTNKTTTGSIGNSQVNQNIKSINFTTTTDFPFQDKPQLSDEELNYIKNNRIHRINTTSVAVKQNTITPPQGDRVEYIQNRLLDMDRKNLSPILNTSFIHYGGPVENLYDEASIRAFSLLRRKLNYPVLQIVRGFDVTSEETSHALGIAIDIYAETPYEALYIADTAYLIGFRAIAIGPKFVHVDTGPACAWKYGEFPIYRGPGTLKVSDLQNGYR